MKNKLIIIIILLALILVLAGLFIFLNFSSNNNSSIKFETEQDIKNMINTIYKDISLPSLETATINLTDNNIVESYTGIKDNSNLELLVVSEPLMSSQAYSMVVAKYKEGTNIDNIKQEMYNNVNMRKWICVSAEKLYITNYENTIVYIMASEEWAKPVYNSFKNYVNNKIGKELEKSEDTDYELPDEILLQ